MPETTKESLWFKDAVIYEVHVKCFSDSDGDGIGDFKGLTRKLDYLRDLGVTAIWLLPFYPSPLKDDGYDIADPVAVNPDYGTVADFKKFLREAHKRDLKVITELVLNHTSDRHAWFQRARLAKPGSRHRNYYVWSDTPEKYRETRIIFKDFETSNWSWDPVAKAYFWHRFYSHQPDLNFDSPDVRREVLKILDFWFKMGVDGLRLDAIPYLFEREGTNCENLPETYEFIRELRSHVDRKFSNRMLLAEANQWPEDAVAYFGNGDMCHMAYHFPLMPRMFMSLQMEDRFPIIDILDQTPAIPENSQWALFLRNHDELTLEMVTDEERDYMYRMYARDPRARINLGIRRRLAPLLDNDRRKIELMNVLLMTMPGSVVLYYGDELGMGDNYYLGDRDGVRTPMQWSADRNAGFSKANPQRLFLPVIIDPEYHYEAINVENQERNRSSLLWWMKHFIAMRKRYKAFGRGGLDFVLPDNPKVLAYLRTYRGTNDEGTPIDECLLVVVNLSRHPQVARLDLSAHTGHIPVEVFSRNPFPVIGQDPTTLTLNPHGYYLFSLEPSEDEADLPADEPTLCRDLGNGDFLDTGAKEVLQSYALPTYLRRRKLLGMYGRRFKSMEILEALPLGLPGRPTWLLVTSASFIERSPLTANLLVSFAFDAHAMGILAKNPQDVICTFEHEGRTGILFEGIHPDGSCRGIMDMLTKKQSIRGRHGEIRTVPAKAARGAKCDLADLQTSLFMSQRINTILRMGSEYFLKIFRLAEDGMNPDLEIVRYLTEKAGFTHTPECLGALEYKRPDSEPVVAGVMKRYVHCESDARVHCLDAADRFFERVQEARPDIKAVPSIPASPGLAARTGLPKELRDLLGESDLELFHRMGSRTAEMHMALSRSTSNADFAPEPFTMLYQRSVFQTMQSNAKRMAEKLRKALDGNVVSDQTIPGASASPGGDGRLAGLRERCRTVVRSRDAVMDQFQRFYKDKIDCLKIRIHGDYHLGHLLYTGKDYIVIDFEGKPEKPLSQRRIKRSPFRDVADLQRSLCHTAFIALTQRSLRPEDRLALEPWSEFWHSCAFGAFLSAYMDTAAQAPFMPDDFDNTTVMLDCYILEKAFLEIGRVLDGHGELEPALTTIERILGLEPPHSS